LDKYHVMLKPKALEDIDSIDEYIALELQNVDAALKLVEKLETAVISLERLPLCSLNLYRFTINNLHFE
jgi:plasmid stabilization system protein ParE